MADPKNDFSAFPEAGVQSAKAGEFEEFAPANQTPDLQQQGAIAAETGARARADPARAEYTRLYCTPNIHCNQ